MILDLVYALLYLVIIPCLCMSNLSFLPKWIFEFCASYQNTWSMVADSQRPVKDRHGRSITKYGVLEAFGSAVDMPHPCKVTVRK